MRASMRRLAMIAPFVLAAACTVNPTYEGKAVDCETEDDCAHLGEPGAFLCEDGLCVQDSSHPPDPCRSFPPCDAPPKDYCDGNVLVAHDASGLCAVVEGEAECSYSSHRQACGNAYECVEDANGARCEEIILSCADIEPCDSPPDDHCDVDTFVTHDPDGICDARPRGAECRYERIELDCDSPPADHCEGTDLVSFEQTGACRIQEGEAVCAYDSQRHACGHEDGYFCDPEEIACAPDPSRCTAICHPLDTCVLDQCHPGTVEVSIDSALPEVWVREHVTLSGTALWSGGESTLSVECSVAEVDASFTAELLEEEAVGDLYSTGWSCAMDLPATTPEGSLTLIVTATDSRDGEERPGEAGVTVSRDITPPVIDLPEVSPDTVFTPQSVTVQIIATDAMGSEAGLLNAVYLRVISPSGGYFSEAVFPGPDGESTFTFPLRPDPDVPAGEPLVEQGTHFVEAWAIDEACSLDDECMNEVLCFQNPDCAFVGQPAFGGFKRAVFVVERDVAIRVDLWDPDLADNPVDGEDHVQVLRDGRYVMDVVAEVPEQVLGMPRLEQRDSAYGAGRICTDVPLSLDNRLEDVSDGRWRAEVSAMVPCLPNQLTTYSIVATWASVWDFREGASEDSIEAPDPGSIVCENGDDLDGATCSNVSVSRIRWMKDVCNTQNCRALTPAVSSDGNVYVVSEHYVSTMFGVVAIAPGDGTTSTFRGARHGVPMDGAMVLDAGNDSRLFVPAEVDVNLDPKLVAFDAGTQEWIFPGGENLLLAGLPAMSSSWLYLPILAGSEVTERVHAIAYVNPWNLTNMGSDLTALSVSFDTKLSLFQDTSTLGDPLDRLAIFTDRDGVTADCDNLYGLGWGCTPTLAPFLGLRQGEVPAHPQGYFIGTSGDSGGSADQIRLRNWGSGITPPSTEYPRITAGPVLSPTHLAAANQDSFILWNYASTAAPLPFIGFFGGHTPPTQGISLGTSAQGPRVYLLHEDGLLQVRAHSVHEALWKVVLPGGIAPSATTTLSKWGHRALDQFEQGPQEIPVGVIYVSHGPWVSAIITDDLGPVHGWPNERGSSARTGRWDTSINQSP